jgi:hypothetical protein
MVRYSGAWEADGVARFLDRATAPLRLARHFS